MDPSEHTERMSLARGRAAEKKEAERLRMSAKRAAAKAKKVRAL